MSLPFTRRSFVKAASASTAAAALPHLAFAAAPSTSQPWRDQGILDLSRSPHARLRNIPVRAVTLHSGFWTPRRAANVNASIPSMHTLLEEHGRMNNFRRLTGQSTAPQIGKYYSDSDVYKWTEAASFAQQSHDPALFRTQVEAITQLVQAVQEPSGYLNTYYVGDRTALRMTPETQVVGHELYNIGHLIQAAVAQFRATGDTRLLNCCITFVDKFLLDNFGPDKKPIVSGHPEIELALIELFRCTRNPRHLALAGYILNGDKRVPLTADQTTYMFCGIPFTARTHLEGHAVRAMYACSGATDYFLETGDPATWKTLTTLWQDLVRDQMYITGGVGARRKNEAFGDPFELPNLSAYGESCAAIGNMMWNWRMLHADPDARYTDVIERALYNGINSGMSLSGTTYCYRNPLAFDPADPRPIRNPWYDTTCCPPNLERTFASLPGYFYSTSADGLYVHLFHNSTLDWHLESGTPIRVEQSTEYPRNGRVALAVTPARPTAFALYLRIPGWAPSTRVAVNGQPVDTTAPGTYLRIHRLWKPGDSVTMDMTMVTTPVVADRRVAEDLGKVAIQHGPLIYCAESLDQPNTTPVTRLALTLGHATAPTPHPGKVGPHDVDIIDHPAQQTALAPSTTALYAEASPTPTQPTIARLIPYYAWANRTPTEMAVWLPVA